MTTEYNIETANCQNKQNFVEKTALSSWLCLLRRYAKYTVEYDNKRLGESRDTRK